VSKELQQFIQWVNEQPINNDDGAEVIAGDPVTVFLNRWHWRGERAVVERELRDLISTYQRDGMAEVCRNAGCQEIR
jgi:hypothetical protein